MALGLQTEAGCGASGLQWPLGPGKSHEQISSWGLQEDGRRTLRLCFMTQSCAAGPVPVGLRKPYRHWLGALVPLQRFWGPLLADVTGSPKASSFPVSALHSR